jgi:hypothetical protein
VAILVAARRAGDRDLERHARTELENRCGIRLTFVRREVHGRRREVAAS